MHDEVGILRARYGHDAVVIPARLAAIGFDQTLKHREPIFEIQPVFFFVDTAA